MNRWNKWRRKKGKRIKHIKVVFLATGLLLVLVVWQNLSATKDAPALKEILGHVREIIYEEVFDTHMPVVMAAFEEEKTKPSLQEYIKDKLQNIFPVLEYTMNRQEYDTQVESQLTYQMLAAREGVDEQYRDGKLITEGEQEESNTAHHKADGEEADDKAVSDKEADNKNAKEEEGDGTKEEQKEQEVVSAGAFFTPVTEPVVQISREKLNDFDYLVQHFYTVDRTTTIDGSQLNAQELLSVDLKLKTTAEQPQILIHHTHSQEAFADSNGDVSTSIVGVGAYLTQILQEQYGFYVIHDTGAYDVIDHDNAYSYAGPAVEQILAEYPSIEVVIDVHRDGIEEGHLVSEVNGKPTANIMFFNGLSRTTSNGDLEYLANPYIKDNLAFSLQMKLAAEEYYPGFTRANFLKGYRYNLHYVPKSMLVEVGAQTNTVEEAMNAMEPLADLLYKVLAP